MKMTWNPQVNHESQYTDQRSINARALLKTPTKEASLDDGMTHFIVSAMVTGCCSRCVRTAVSSARLAPMMTA
jgi:hypothetical protein